MHLKKRFYNYMIFLSLVIPILGADGCRNPWQAHPERVAPKPSAYVLDLYDQAFLAYQFGSYEKAAESFDAVRQQTQDGKTARMALYGLACSRIMAAETPEAYYQALVLWRSWVSGAPLHPDNENPLLFEPLIERKMLFSGIPLTKDESDKVDDDTVPRWLHIKVKRELETLENKVIKTEQELQQKSKLVESQEKQIKKLKQQIKALETIDQKIQKKKNAIPSTD
jgi:TolA-binding protein